MHGIYTKCSIVTQDFILKNVRKAVKTLFSYSPKIPDKTTFQKTSNRKKKRTLKKLPKIIIKMHHELVTFLFFSCADVHCAFPVALCVSFQFDYRTIWCKKIIIKLLTYHLEGKNLLEFVLIRVLLIVWRKEKTTRIWNARKLGLVLKTVGSFEWKEWFLWLLIGEKLHCL